MYRTEGVLALLVLYIGLAHSFSWDFVVAGWDRLDFYDSNGTLSHTEDIPTHLNYISSLAYDPLHNNVLFAFEGYYYYSICGLNIETKKITYLVTNVINWNATSSYSTNVQIAYDPATQLLFWTESKLQSIFSKPGYTYAVDQNLIIKTDLVIIDREIYGLTVDSCGGYIYWTTDSVIERARFDGSDRQIVVNKKVRSRVGIAIDHQTQKMYWLDNYGDIEAMYLTIESADLNGKNRRRCYLKPDDSSLGALLVSKDFIYWMSGEAPTFFKLTKNPPHYKKWKSKTFKLVNYSYPRGMALHYKIEDLLPNPINSETNYCASLNVSTDVSLFCVHGTKLNGESRCECTQGYIGERCDVSVCHNYCFQGECSVSAEGQPKCRCKAGHSGERCEVNACHEYCSNNGVCSLNEDSEPVCQCTGDFQGERCGVPVSLVKICLQTNSLLRDILNTDVTAPAVTLGKGVKSTYASTVV